MTIAPGGTTGPRLPSLARALRKAAVAAVPLACLLTTGGCIIIEKPVVRQNTSVAVVQSAVPVDPDIPESKTRRRHFEVAADALRRAGVPFRVLTDEDVRGGRLGEHAVAVFPFTYAMDLSEQLAVVNYLRGGGKAIICDRMPAGVARVLGVRIRGAEFDIPANRYDRCVLVPPGIEGAPEWFTQHSWHVHLAEPHGHGARVLYRWHDAQHNPTGGAAVILSERGAYVSHVLTRSDRAAKSQLLAALIAHFVPDVWPRAAERALADVGRVGRADSIAALRGLVATAQADDRAKDADEILDEAEETVARADRALSRGEFAAAVELAGIGHRLATEAYVRTIPTRDSELRGVWLANPRGVAAWGWDRTIRHLSRMGFNAVFPIMAWGGEIAYGGEYLPLAAAAGGEDQLAACLAACKKYGVECHVWKINFNLGRCHPEIMAKFKAQDRLQRDRHGKQVRWLCPTDPRNINLERTIMIEMLRKYDLDGLHFDYIRYPSVDACFCPRCREKFEQFVGKSFVRWPHEMLNGPQYEQFRRWRADNITRLVKIVSRQAREIRPSVRLSAAVFPDPNRDRWVVGQDWRRWVEEGLLDFVCPMNYFPMGEFLEGRIRHQVQAVGGAAPVYVGLGAWQMQDVSDLAEQVDLARELGADGYVLFHYDDLTLAEEWMPLLRKGPTAINAVTPHSAPNMNLRIVSGVTQRDGALVARAAEGFRVAGWIAPGAGVESARLELHTLDGAQVHAGGRLREGRRREAGFTPSSGAYRPAIVGRAGDKPFVRRGRIVRVER